MNPPSDDLQVAARVWLPGKGCQQLHTSGISDADAHALIEHFAGQMPPLTDERTSWKPHSWRIYPTVYLIPQRRPDPDNPHRNVTNLWILLDPRRRLSDANVRRIAETSVSPNADSEFDSVVREWVDRATPSPSSVSQSSSSPSTTTPATAADSNVSPRREPHQRSLKWVVMAAILALVLVLVVYQVSQTKSSTGEPTVAKPPDTTAPVGGEKDLWEDWQKEKDILIKEEMKPSIQLRRPDLELNKLNETEILEKFVSLFYVEPSELGLDNEELKQMKTREENTSPHPMIDFLNQFKLPTPSVKIETDECWGKECFTCMMLLRDRFPKLLDDAHFRTLPPHEIVQALKNQLDYEAFFDRWHKTNDPEGPEKPYLEGSEGDLAGRWVKKVRIYLKKRFQAFNRPISELE